MSDSSTGKGNSSDSGTERISERHGSRSLLGSTSETPVRHFHPPRDLDAHKQSRIEIERPPELVTIAVLKTWWTAVENGDESLVNAQDSLP